MLREATRQRSADDGRVRRTVPVSIDTLSDALVLKVLQSVSDCAADILAGSEGWSRVFLSGKMAIPLVCQ
eukprot:COSAG02_NODE_26554_length_630_cov_1.290019_1_plen_69_part_01